MADEPIEVLRINDALARLAAVRDALRASAPPPAPPPQFTIGADRIIRDPAGTALHELPPPPPPKGG